MLSMCVVVLGGCIGQRQEQEQKKRAAQQKLLEQLDAPGRRIVWRDQHDDVMGKWRIRRHQVKVYDAGLRPRGHVRVVHNAEGGFQAIEGTHVDGKVSRIAAVQGRNTTRYSFGERLMLERQGDQWVLGQLDPFVILARIRYEGEVLRIQETRRNKNAVVRHVRPPMTPGQRAQVEAEDGRFLWAAPLKISAEQATPYVLRHASLSAMEQAMLSMFLETHKPVLAHPTEDEQESGKKEP